MPVPGVKRFLSFVAPDHGVFLTPDDKGYVGPYMIHVMPYHMRNPPLARRKAAKARTLSTLKS
jgi:hypothetical protein